MSISTGVNMVVSKNVNDLPIYQNIWEGLKVLYSNYNYDNTILMQLENLYSGGWIDEWTLLYASALINYFDLDVYTSFLVVNLEQKDNISLEGDYIKCIINSKGELKQEQAFISAVIQENEIVILELSDYDFNFKNIIITEEQIKQK